MKIDFSKEQVTVTKITDDRLDDIITPFFLRKIDDVSTSRQKRRGDYNGYQYLSRCVNEWDEVGLVYHFNVIPIIPSFEFDTTTEIEMLTTSDILNWMCAEGIIESGVYLIEVVQHI